MFEKHSICVSCRSWLGNIYTTRRAMQEQRAKPHGHKKTVPFRDQQQRVGEQHRRSRRKKKQEKKNKTKLKRNYVKSGKAVSGIMIPIFLIFLNFIQLFCAKLCSSTFRTEWRGQTGEMQKVQKKNIKWKKHTHESVYCLR